jgi:hypothetical protein
MENATALRATPPEIGQTRTRLNLWLKDFGDTTR